MRYAQIRKTDIANGVGIRTSLFVTGCEFNCKNCFNKEFQDFSYGNEFTKEVEDSFINCVNQPRIVGATILGGEPMHRTNRFCVAAITTRIKSECVGKTVWVYTGFKYEKLLEESPEVLKDVDVLVDGLFVEGLKSPTLRFKGSSNQRIIDVQESLRTNKIVLWEEDI